MNNCEAVEITCMCMIYDGKGNAVVQHRVGGWAGIAFPGGHVERGELFHDAVVREVKEETGLDVKDLELCGLKNVFRDDGKRYVVIMYKSCSFSGELTSSEEGDVEWMKLSEIKKEDCPRSFFEMIELFEDDSKTECFFSEDGELLLI